MSRSRPERVLWCHTCGVRAALPCLDDGHLTIRNAEDRVGEAFDGNGFDPGDGEGGGRRGIEVLSAHDAAG